MPTASKARPSALTATSPSLSAPWPSSAGTARCCTSIHTDPHGPPVGSLGLAGQQAKQAAQLRGRLWVVVHAQINDRFLLGTEHEKQRTSRPAAIPSGAQAGFERQQESLGKEIPTAPLEGQRHGPDGVRRIHQLTSGDVVGAPRVSEDGEALPT